MALAGKIVNGGTNFVVVAILAYSVYVGNVFRSILWPTFPEIDPRTHTHIPKNGNEFRQGDELIAKFWVGTQAWPSKEAPIAEFELQYDWDSFVHEPLRIPVNITKAQLKKGTNILLSTEVKNKRTGGVVRAKGGLIKAIKPPDEFPKYKLMTRTLCPAVKEPAFGRKHIGRGIPKMQVRLVYDQMSYPNYIMPSPYKPGLFVDEFWLTNDQLVTLNSSSLNAFDSEVQLGLMSAPRWRFQQHMEASFAQQAKMFGEDSEEMLQTRDLFANTDPMLLVATLIISVLHIIFEFLAFKNDVDFWHSCDVETLNKYMSVQSILVGIFMQFLLLLYLWDESANILVLGSNVIGILIDMWKVQRAMKLEWKRVGGVPVLWLVSRVKKEKVDDFDSLAMKWLGALLSPGVIGYGIYTFLFDCHRGWYSLFLTFSASCVYSLGFILMTPQVFINYKHKTVAYLPWRKFVYRAISTFIDDLFAFIVRMPTMHRLSCFRDDIVFLIYLYQRHLYPVDKSRTFDEDGYAIGQSGDEAAADSSKKEK